MKNSNDTIGNRIRNLLAQPNTPLRAPKYSLLFTLVNNVHDQELRAVLYLMAMLVRITVNLRYPGSFGQHF
jgi:hypothetical protein